MNTFILNSHVWLPVSLKEAFLFFTDAHNLELLTPAWLNFQVLTPDPIPMEVGARIEYKLCLHGVPIRWQSEISAWDPPFQFVDEQRRGPYRVWIHEHRFSEKDGGTLVEDHVEYAVFGGRVVNLLVARDLRAIFEYRRQQMKKRFGLLSGRENRVQNTV